QNGRTPFSLDFVGHETTDPVWAALVPGCASGKICRLSDSAFVTLDIGAQGGSMDSVARPSSLCVTPLSCATSMTSPTDRITITGIAPIPIVGTLLTKVGQTTGWTAGIVTISCINEFSDSIFEPLCQTEFIGGSDGGDSGSPVIAVGGFASGMPLPTSGTIA